jgi:hypothetical protein
MIGATFGTEPPLGKPLKSIAPSSCEKKKGHISFSKNYTSFSSDTILECCPKKTRKKFNMAGSVEFYPSGALTQSEIQRCLYIK